MHTDPRPSAIIQALVASRMHGPDEQLLAELAALPILPAEDAAAWNDDQTTATTTTPA